MCSHGEDWTLSVDQGWLQALEFSLHLIDLLSILLRHTSSESCSGSVRAADHQTFTMTVFSCKGGFGKCFGASPQSIHWAGLQQLIFLKVYILNNFIEIFYKSIWAKCMLYHTHTHSRQPTTTCSSTLMTFCRENTFTTSRMQKSLSKSSSYPEYMLLLHYLKREVTFLKALIWGSVEKKG